MNKKCLGCGEYQATTKTNEEYQQILEAVGKTKDLVVYVTDVLNVEQDLYDIRKFLPNKILLVLTLYKLKGLDKISKPLFIYKIII